MTYITRVSITPTRPLWVILLTLQANGVSSQCSPSPGTHRGIRDIVHGRCLQYKTFVHPALYCDTTSTGKNCSEITDLFISAFSFQPTCNVTLDRYDDFIKAAHFDVPTDQTLFWSGVYGVAQRYSERGLRAMPIEDTLIGFLADGLNFCAEESGEGIIYDRVCNNYAQTENCSHNAEFSYWAMASSNFASTASGKATVMLNASNEEAFRESSFFGTWEVANIDPSRVSHMTILIVHIPGQPVRTNCDSASIVNLKLILQTKTITTDCQDSPWHVQTMLCMDYPDVEECKKEAAEINHPNTASSSTSYLSLLITAATIYFSMSV